MSEIKRVDIGSTVVLSDGKTYMALAHPDICVRDAMKTCSNCAFKPARTAKWPEKLCREVHCSEEGKKKRIFKEVV